MAGELETQATLQRQIAETLSNINVKLQDQLKIQQLINSSASGNLNSAEQSGRATEDALRAAGVGSSDLTANLDENTRAIVGSDDAAATAAVTLGDLAEKTLAVGAAGATAYDSLGKALHNLVPAQLRTELDHIQQQFGGLTSSGGPYAASNKQAAAFVDLTHEVYEGLQDTEGAMFQAFGMMPKRALGDLNVVMGQFSTLMTGPQGMLNSLDIAKVATGEFVIEQQGLAKAMGLSVEQQQVFMSRQISLTGEASNDMMREAAVYSKRLAAATGDSAKMISKNIVAIINDTEKFGNVSVAEAARISVTLRQLGLGYEELGVMVGKYMNFEDAATSVAALTTVFGVQMDAMEMMQLANEDQEGFLRRIREQFLSTAKSVDDMSLAEKRLIMQQTGLSNVEAVERLLDPTAAISSFESLANETTNVGESTSEVMEMLADDIVDLQRITEYSTDDIMNNINEKFRIPLAKVAVEAEAGATRMAAAFEGAIPARVTEGMSFLGKGLAEFTNIDAAKVGEISEQIKAMADALLEAATAAGNSDLAEVVTEIASATVGSDAVDTVTTGMSTAFDGMVTSFQGAIDKLVAAIRDSPLGAGSASEIGQETTDGIIIPMKTIPGVAEEVFTEAAGAAAEALDEIPNALNEDLERAAALVDESSAAWNTAMIRSFQDEGLSKAHADVWNNMTDISSKALKTQLGDSDSAWSRMASSLGEVGVKYGDLTEDQKKFYAEEFKLGKNWEQELSQIFESQAFKSGAEKGQKSGLMQDMLAEFREEGAGIDSFSNTYLKMVEDKYGLTRDMMEAALEEGSDIEGIVTGGLEARQRQIEEEKRAKSTSADEGGEGGGSRRTRAQHLNVSRKLLESSQAVATTSTKMLSALLEIQTAVSTSPALPAIEVKVDGKSIVDYVVDNPGSVTHAQQLVLKAYPE